jgi:hypothetical protein
MQILLLGINAVQIKQRHIQGKRTRKSQHHLLERALSHKQNQVNEEDLPQSQQVYDFADKFSKIFLQVVFRWLDLAATLGRLAFGARFYPFQVVE